MNRGAQRFFLTAFITGMAGLLPTLSSLVFAQAIVPEANRSVPQD